MFTEEQLEAAQALRSLAREQDLNPPVFSNFAGDVVYPKQIIIEGLFAVVEAGFSSKSLNEWREAVIERDKYKCVLCDSKEHLEAHHCKPKSQFPELAYDVNNGVMLCKRCHIVVVHGNNTFDLRHCYRFWPLWRALLNSPEDSFDDR